MKLLILPLIAIILISGCVGQQTQTSGNEEQIINACVQLCQSEKSKGTDLNNGPCLSNTIAENWVCDVAHSPRTTEDNNPENQCPEFGKTAQHFVEVDPDCNFIRKY